MQNSEFRIQTLRAGRPGSRAVSAFCILNFALMLASTGCASKAGAATVPDEPPLARPAPPPREITPVEDVVVAATPPPAPEPAVGPPARPAAATAKPPARQDPVAAAQPPVQPVVTPAPPVPEPREVRAVPSAAAAA